MSSYSVSCSATNAQHVSIQYRRKMRLAQLVWDVDVTLRRALLRNTVCSPCICCCAFVCACCVCLSCRCVLCFSVAYFFDRTDAHAAEFPAPRGLEDRLEEHALEALLDLRHLASSAACRDFTKEASFLYYRSLFSSLKPLLNQCCSLLRHMLLEKVPWRTASRPHSAPRPLRASGGASTRVAATAALAATAVASSVASCCFRRERHTMRGASV